MARIEIALVASLFLLPAMAFAKDRPPISDAELAAITARGRALYEYDVAAWHGSDALSSTHPPKERLSRYICRKTDAGWVVSFGKLNETGDAFVVAYQAMQGADLEHFTLKQMTPPQMDRGFLLGAAKAIDLALRGFKGADHQYNVAVLPGPEGKLFVYVLPAQVKDNVYPLGADERYLISGDGSTILEDRRLHQSLLESEPPKEAGAKHVAGIHNHVLSDVPEDSDVFHVLTQRPPLPEYVGTKKWIYVVHEDGMITWEKMK